MSSSSSSSEYCSSESRPGEALLVVVVVPPNAFLGTAAGEFSSTIGSSFRLGREDPDGNVCAREVPLPLPDELLWGPGVEGLAPTLGLDDAALIPPAVTVPAPRVAVVAPGRAPDSGFSAELLPVDVIGGLEALPTLAGFEGTALLGTAVGASAGRGCKRPPVGALVLRRGKAALMLPLDAFARGVPDERKDMLSILLWRQELTIESVVQQRHAK